VAGARRKAAVDREAGVEIGYEAGLAGNAGFVSQGPARMEPMQPGDWIALAALLIAVLVGIAQYRLQKTTARSQTELQERLGTIEEERRSEELTRRTQALIVCSKRKEPTSSGHLATWLVFTNDGQAAALDVWFEREPLENIIAGNQGDTYPRLAPGQEWKILATPSMNDPERVTFRYGWSDDAGSHEEEIIYSVFG
jgi:hypothetical protein